MQLLNRKILLSSGTQRAGRRFGHFVAAITLLVTAGRTASAATISVNPGQSIQNAITSAAAGDTVLVAAGDYTGGITINKAITVQGQPGAKIRASTAGSGTGVTIASDNCTLIGFYIDSFNMAISVAGAGSTSGFKNGVTIKNNHTYYSQFHCWIGGTNWLVEGNDFERVRWWNGQGDADYTRMFGTGHIFRGNYLHGTNFSNTDLAPASGSDYAHTDGIQYYGSNGEVLKNCIIENNFFTDFHQGLFLCDENTGSLQNLTIRNNVFWGQTYTPAPGSANYNGIPSWGICIGKNVGGTGMIVQNNLIYNVANFYGVRAASSGNWAKNIVVGKGGSGTVYDPSTSTPSSVTVGNLLYGYAWLGQSGFTGTDTTANPMLTNVASPLGADGIPMTSDDGWRPLYTGAVGIGPQISAGGTSGPDTTAPVITLNGVTPMTVGQGSVYNEPAATALDSRDGEVIVTISGTANTAVLGAYTITYTARDAAGNSATKSRTVNVVAATQVNTAPTISLSGPVSPIQLAAGSTQATLTINANAADAQGPVTLLWTLPSGTATTQQVTVTQNVGTVTYSCKVTDAGGLTATASMAVTVLAASTSTVAKQWIKVRHYDANNVLIGYAWVSGTTQTAQPTTAP